MSAKGKADPGFPTEIRCQALRYRVISDPDLAAKDEGSWGLIHHHDATVRIAAQLEPRTKAETLIHESIHVIWTSSADHRENKNEALVDRTAGGILDVLLNSPGLLEYLIAVRDAE